MQLRYHLLTLGLVFFSGPVKGAQDSDNKLQVPPPNKEMLEFFEKNPQIKKEVPFGAGGEVAIPPPPPMNSAATRAVPPPQQQQQQPPPPQAGLMQGQTVQIPHDFGGFRPQHVLGSQVVNAGANYGQQPQVLGVQMQSTQGNQGNQGNQGSQGSLMQPQLQAQMQSTQPMQSMQQQQFQPMQQPIQQGQPIQPIQQGQTGNPIALAYYSPNAMYQPPPQNQPSPVSDLIQFQAQAQQTNPTSQGNQQSYPTPAPANTFSEYAALGLSAFAGHEGPAFPHALTTKMLNHDMSNFNTLVLLLRTISSTKNFPEDILGTFNLSSYTEIASIIGFASCAGITEPYATMFTKLMILYILKIPFSERIKALAQMEKKKVGQKFDQLPSLINDHVASLLGKDKGPDSKFFFDGLTLDLKAGKFEKQAIRDIVTLLPFAPCVKTLLIGDLKAGTKADEKELNQQIIEGLAVFSSVERELEKLKIVNCEGADALFNTLVPTGWTILGELSLKDTQFKAESFKKFLAALPAINGAVSLVSIRGNSELKGVPAVEALAYLLVPRNSLTKLELVDCPLGNEAFERLLPDLKKGGKNLKELRVERCELTRADLIKKYREYATEKKVELKGIEKGEESVKGEKGKETVKGETVKNESAKGEKGEKSGKGEKGEKEKSNEKKEKNIEQKEKNIEKKEKNNVKHTQSNAQNTQNTELCKKDPNFPTQNCSPHEKPQPKNAKKRHMNKII